MDLTDYPVNIEFIPPLDIMYSGHTTISVMISYCGYVTAFCMDCVGWFGKDIYSILPFKYPRNLIFTEEMKDFKSRIIRIFVGPNFLEIIYLL